MTNQTMPEGTPTTLIGFPLAPCPRCGGTGQYPSAAWKGQCLRCSGTGWADYSSSSKRQRLAYEDAVIASQTTPLPELQIGDKVLMSDGMTERRWMTITQIHVDPTCPDGTLLKDGRTHTLTGHYTIICDHSSISYIMFDDGEPIEPTPTLRRWSGRLDPAPYLAKIRY